MDNIFNLSSFSSSLGNPGRSDSRSFQVGGKSAKDRGASFIEDQVNFGRSTGYLRSNRYCILFQGVPSSLEMQRQDNGFLWGLDNKRLSLNCLQASIPESSFSTSDFRVVGPKRSIPYSQDFGDTNASFQFNCGTDLYEYTFFRSWQRSIIDPVSRYVSFYDDYAKQCSISIIPLPNFVYNFGHVLELLESERLYGIKMTEVYPKSVGLNQFQNASTNTLTVSSVNFAYRELIPYASWDDDTKYAMHAGISQIMDMTSNTVRVSDDQLNGIRRDLTNEEKQRLQTAWLAKAPAGAKIDGGRPDYTKYLKNNPNDPTLPQYAGEPDLFLNNLITSGINTSALFRGI
jgi:hypothetical protein